MLKHIMDKWDSYLSILLGVFLAAIAAMSITNPKLMMTFKYYVFLMIGVVIFDTVKNFGQHESALWKMAAILSNGIVLVSCAIILQQMFSMLTAAKISSLPLLSKLMAMPNFMLYLGIFLIIENALWVYVYDHF
ncbi:hypothetical protein HYY73_06590 [Candidatus Woesearchaeota archaeon]|nr:hypothetical protein [Candidatus Woesearchaeota archaeon]